MAKTTARYRRDYEAARDEARKVPTPLRLETQLRGLERTCEPDSPVLRAFQDEYGAQMAKERERSYSRLL